MTDADRVNRDLAELTALFAMHAFNLTPERTAALVVVSKWRADLIAEARAEGWDEGWTAGATFRQRPGVNPHRSQP